MHNLMILKIFPIIAADESPILAHAPVSCFRRCSLSVFASDCGGYKEMSSIFADRPNAGGGVELRGLSQ